MEIIEAKIAEIKNLKLIYVYAVDSVFQGDTNKYIGAEVVFSNNQKLKLDYRSEFFQQFLKRILERYNKEKSKRNIILLGALTKQLVQDSFYTILKDTKEGRQTFGIPMFEVKSNEIKKYEKYLIKILKTILKIEFNYDTVNILSINGFNNKYIVRYNIGSIDKFFNMLIFIDHTGNLSFKISNINGKKLGVYGSINLAGDTLSINWVDKLNNLNGEIVYDSKNISTEEKVETEDKIIYADNTVDTLIDDDEKIIKFYFDLCELEELKNVLKIDDYSYLMSREENLIEGESGIFYNFKDCQMNIFEDHVSIRYTIKNSLSKYNNQINVALDEVTDEFTLRKVVIENKYYILIEKKSIYEDKQSYLYQIVSLNKNINLTEPFEIKSKHDITDEVETYSSVKEYIKTYESGEKNGKKNNS